MSRGSRIGPRVKAGKNVSAPTITIVDTSNVVNSGPGTGNVPAEGGAVFFPARLPAMPRMGITTRNRPSSVATPMVALNHSVFGLRPPNAEPLLPVADVYA